MSEYHVKKVVAADCRYCKKKKERPCPKDSDPQPPHQTTSAKVPLDHSPAYATYLKG